MSFGPQNRRTAPNAKFVRSQGTAEGGPCRGGGLGGSTWGEPTFAANQDRKLGFKGDHRETHLFFSRRQTKGGENNWRTRTTMGGGEMGNVPARFNGGGAYKHGGQKPGAGRNNPLSGGLSR